MNLHARVSRFFSQVTLLAAALFLAMACLLLFEAVTGTSRDEKARACAVAATSEYMKEFRTGEPLSDVAAALAKRETNMLHRGTDVLIVAGEGQRIWYCSHNYFGTALHFQQERLQQVATEQWLETCL